jgi:hypothetical protein
VKTGEIPSKSSYSPDKFSKGFMDSFKIIGDNIHTVGWGTIISFVGFMWRKSIQAAQKEKAGEAAVAQLNKMATNDFPHLQESLVVLKDRHEESVRILTSIDKNISILVDRSPRG